MLYKKEHFVIWWRWSKHHCASFNKQFFSFGNSMIYNLYQLIKLKYKSVWYYETMPTLICNIWWILLAYWLDYNIRLGGMIGTACINSRMRTIERRMCRKQVVESNFLLVVECRPYGRRNISENLKRKRRKLTYGNWMRNMDDLCEYVEMKHDSLIKRLENCEKWWGEL